MANLPPPNPCPNDAYVRQRLFELLSGRMHEKEELLGTLSLYIRRMHLGRLLSLYDAYKMVVDLPGSVVELGVFRGETLLFFAKLMELLNVNDRSCKVIGFDNFAGFPELDEKDGPVDKRVDKVVGGWSSANLRDHLLEVINAFDHDRFAGQKPRIELVEGDIRQTVPKYAADNPGLRIRLLHLDCDLYEPTLVALKHLYDRVVPGGIVILDEYAFNEFPGESKALEEFFGERMPVIRKFSMYSNPGGYFIKGATR
ncbi:MAG: TylF/MycF/NovP-related O-methyltransferase [Planctomycetota bacterium]